MDGHPIRGLVLILGLVILNALVSAAEAAIQNVNEGMVKKAVQEGNPKAKRFLRLFGNSSSLHKCN